MGIKIYNTLSGKKDKFSPIKKSRVGIYACGITVYDECHIGHVRGAFTFDIVRRYFYYKGYRVRYVRNITDVDDKIIEKAMKESRVSGRTVANLKAKVKEVAERYIKSYYRDMETLGIKKADIEPRATGHIKDMIKLVTVLIKKGYAYKEGGDVYFKVRRFKGYGRLSGQSLDEMSSGVRVELEKNKKDPLDFALWKHSGKGEPSWESPWGPGRPGWHIECSVMSMKYLGKNFDIHGGGRDLVFPHHENEIAQSESATGKKFANYWMHNGLLTIDKTKMAKSLGNFVSVKEIAKRFHPEALKIFFLSFHYRSPVDFTFEKIEEAKKARERFCILLNRINNLEIKGGRLKVKKYTQEEIDTFRKRFEEAMDDDFNTAEALAVLFDLVTYMNKQLSVVGYQLSALRYAKGTLLQLGRVLGLFEKDRSGSKSSKISEKEIKRLLGLRDNARKNGDFKTADRIRADLDKAGIILEDSKDGTTWRVK